MLKNEVFRVKPILRRINNSIVASNQVKIQKVFRNIEKSRDIFDLGVLNDQKGTVLRLCVCDTPS